MYQIKKLAIITTITLATASSAYAGCEWTHGSLGQTVEATSARLKQYSECKTDCEPLAAGLTRTISLMNTATECGAGVLTAKNSQMIEFFNRRFQLIRKLKTGQDIAVPNQPPKPVQLDERERQMEISPSAYQALWLEEDSPKPQAKAPQQRPAQQQRPAPAPQRTVKAPHSQQAPAQQAVKRAPTAYELQLAQQRRVEQQRQIQLQRQAQIRQQNLRHAEARKQRILAAQHQERIRMKQLQFQRAKALHIAKQKAREKQFARAQN